MFNQLYTLFLSVLLLSTLAVATPINQDRTIHHFKPIPIPRPRPWYFWLPLWRFPRPNPPKTTTTIRPGIPPTSVPTVPPVVPTTPPTVPPVVPTSAPTVPPVVPTTPPTTPPGPTSAPSVPPVVPTSAPTVPPVIPPSSSTTQPVPPTSSPSTPPPGTVIPVGEIINDCTVEGTVALTFDDGPFEFTSELLDIFARNNAKATLFVNGENFGSITDQADVILRAFNEGHQIGSHTFGHAHLSQLGRAEIESEMERLDDVLAGILGGRRPTYMRAPFFEYSDLVLQTMKELEYHVLDASVDTKDFENNTPEGVPESMRLFKEGLDNGGTIVLAHDVHRTTVQLLAQQMLDEVKRRGLRPVTVGECLGDPVANWYRTE